MALAMTISTAISTARAVATTVALAVEAPCAMESRGPCRVNPRISTVARGKTHGRPRKYRGHCPGPPPKSQIMCIRTTAVCAMATTGALAVEAPCTMESRGPCRGNSRISTVARGKTRGRPRKCRGHCRGHCRGPPPKSQIMCVPAPNPQQRGDRDHLETACDETRPTR